MIIKLIGISEFARTIGVSTPTVRRLIDTGEIKAVNVAARRLIPVEELDRVSSFGVGQSRTRKAGNRFTPRRVNNNSP